MLVLSPSHRVHSSPRFRSARFPLKAKICSLGVLGAHQAHGANSTATRNARSTVAQAASTVEADAKAWWKAYPDLWEEVTSRAHFEEAIHDSDFDVILVGAHRYDMSLLHTQSEDGRKPTLLSFNRWYLADWYATWCKGCERAFPEISRMATSDSFQGRVKFVKV